MSGMMTEVTYFWRMFLAFQYLSLRMRSTDWLCFHAVIWKGPLASTGPPTLAGSVHEETPFASEYFLTTSSRATTDAVYAAWFGISPANLSPVISSVLS